MADLQDELRTTAEACETVPAAPAAAAAPPDRPEQARALLAAHPVADGHSGLPSVLRHLPWYDPDSDPDGSADIADLADVPRLGDCPVGAIFWSLRLPAHIPRVTATLEQLDLVRTVVETHPEALSLVLTASESADARSHGRTAVVLGPAPAGALGDSLGVLRALHRIGLRVVTLAGTSWAGEQGLNRFGEEVLREMNRIGVLADLSGASDATIRRALTVSRTPVVCTRSAARALRDHPDNLCDDLLARLGAAKGLCMVPLAVEQTGASVRDVADHLDHVRRLAGPECVGLSGTYDPRAVHPDAADPSCCPNLVVELLERGWPESDIALLTWGNVQRVLRSAEFRAREARQRREGALGRIGELDG